MHDLNARVAESPQLLLAFSCFGDHNDVQIPADLHNRANNGGTGSGLIDAYCQVTIHREDVGLEAGEQVQAGVTGSKVVDSEAQAVRATFSHSTVQVVVNADLFDFSDLEDDSV